MLGDPTALRSSKKDSWNQHNPLPRNQVMIRSDFSPPNSPILPKLFLPDLTHLWGSFLSLLGSVRSGHTGMCSASSCPASQINGVSAEKKNRNLTACLTFAHEAPGMSNRAHLHAGPGLSRQAVPPRLWDVPSQREHRFTACSVTRSALKREALTTCLLKPRMNHQTITTIWNNWQFSS